MAFTHNRRGSYSSVKGQNSETFGVQDGATGLGFRQHLSSHSFLQSSFHSSTDYPTYITWQTLSHDLSERLRQGSVRITRANTLEYATIDEEGEKGLLLRVTTPAARPGITWGVAAFLLVNSALGAGVLNYPSAYDKAGGVAITTVLQVLMMISLGATMLILAYCSDLNGDNTYHDVLLSTCGRRAQQMAAVSILLSCYGVCITFLIIIGDQYDRLFMSIAGDDFCKQFYLNRQFTISLTACIFILPLCYFQRLDFLKYASTLGIFAMLYPVFLTVYTYATNELPPDAVIKTSPDNLLDVVSVIPVICFAYQTHEVVLPIYANMADRNITQLTKSTVACMIFLFIVYSTMGTVGYLVYGSAVKPDIMQMFDANSPWVLIGIAALIVKMITTYPLLVICGRGAFDGLYAELCKVSTETFIRGEQKRRLVITTIWFATTTALAVFISNIGIVIELVGCLACCNIFIFPGMCLVGLYRRPYPSINHPILLLTSGLTLLLSGVGLFIIVFYQSISRMVSQDSSHHLLCTW